MWADWEKRCDYVVSEINKISWLSCVPPEGGFYAWINIKATGEKSIAFAERLLKEQHIALVPGLMVLHLRYWLPSILAMK